jgi:hypothetical protein
MDRIEKLSQHAHFFTARLEILLDVSLSLSLSLSRQSRLGPLGTSTTIELHRVRLHKRKMVLCGPCRGGASCTPRWMSVQYVAYMLRIQSTGGCTAPPTWQCHCLWLLLGRHNPHDQRFESLIACICIHLNRARFKDENGHGKPPLHFRIHILSSKTGSDLD